MIAVLFRRLGWPVGASMILYVGLCIWMHVDRAWQFDEWGSYFAVRQSYGELLGGFGNWQTMNFYLAGLKAIHDAAGDANWLLVVPGIASGAALVWLVAALALELGGGRSGALAAGFLASVNPFLLRYGVTIRAYIFLATFSTGMMVALVAWRRHGRWRDGVLCAACGALALLAHLNAVYTYAAAAVLAICWTLSAPQAWSERVPRLVRLAAPVLGLTALVAVTYLPQVEGIWRFRQTWSDTPPIGVAYLPTVLSGYFGAGSAMIPALALLAYATWRSCRDRRESQWMILAVIVMVVSISAAGVSNFPGAYARFLVATLPLLIVVMADGAALLAAQSRVVGALALVVLAATSLWSVVGARQSLHARPWHHVARYLQRDRTDGDHCALLGPRIFLPALQVYNLPCRPDPVSALAELDPGQAVRLRTIVEPAALTLPPSAKRLGRLRILDLSGPPDAIAATLKEVLDQATGGRAVAGFADVYQQLTALAERLGPASDVRRYERLRMASLARNPLIRDEPPQFRKGDRVNAGPIFVPRWPERLRRHSVRIAR